MLLNTVRGCEGHLRHTGPVSEDSLLDTLGDEVWRASVAQDGNGLSLSEFAGCMERALARFECGGSWCIEIVPVTDADAVIADLRATLTEMESDGTGFAAANFHLDLFYGDGVDVGHFSAQKIEGGANLGLMAAEGPRFFACVVLPTGARRSPRHSGWRREPHPRARRLVA